MFSLGVQDYYKVPISNLFLVELLDDKSTYNDVLGYEFIKDFIHYKVITVMTDIPTKKVFALCQELPQQEN